MDLIATRTTLVPVTTTSLAATLGAAAFGLALLFVAGFAGADVLHASTHDTRHATGFPCH